MTLWRSHSLLDLHLSQHCLHYKFVRRQTRCLLLQTELGRDLQGKRWGPRPLDLDIIFYEGLNRVEEGLEIPHPRWQERPFVQVMCVPLGSFDQSLGFPPMQCDLSATFLSAVPLRKSTTWRLHFPFNGSYASMRADASVVQGIMLAAFAGSGGRPILQARA